MPTALLDVDGTLIDSNAAHARAWVEAFAEHEVKATFEQVVRLIGMGGDKLVPAVTGIDDAKWTKRLGERKNALFFERHFDGIAVFPQVRALLERMKAAGLTLVVATSAKDEELEKFLALAGVADLIEAQATKDYAKRSKPDPDIIGAALERAGVPSGDALLLGDTPYDIEAARAAGVGTVAVNSGGWRDHELAGAVAIYRDAADLLARFDESPFARLARRRDAA
jgi:HAD superfamily hydrolase (TIGR01509 family)